MCYAHLQTCTACNWLIQITYPRCSHAKAYCVEPPACPMRMERRHKKEGLCRTCRVRMASLSDLPEERYGEETTVKKGNEQEVEMEEESTRGNGSRRTRGAKRSGSYVYGEGDGNGRGTSGSGSEDSDAEYVPSSTDDEGYESEESDDAVSTQPSPKHTKRRQSSLSDIAGLIEQEAAQRGKRTRR